MLAKHDLVRRLCDGFSAAAPFGAAVSMVAVALVVGNHLRPPPTMRAAPLSQPPPTGCTAAVDRSTRPAPAVVGTQVYVTLTVRADCERLQAPLHVVFVVDNTAEMGGPRMQGLRDAMADLPASLDLSRSRAGIAVFYSAAEILTELTRDPAALTDAARRFFPRAGGHNLTMGLRAGHQMLRRGRSLPSEPGVTEVIVLIAGSSNDDGPEELVAEATRVKGDGVAIVTVAAGSQADFATLEAIASAPNLYYTETIGERFPSLFREILADLAVVKLTGAQVADHLPDALPYVFGSGVPAPRVRGGDLAWRYAVWPAEGITITYRVSCSQLGRHRAGEGAAVELQFDRGAPQSLAFPTTDVACVPPPTVTPTPSATPTVTPTPPPSPTPSPTATATATPAVRALYLPLAWRGHCLPAFRRADVVLALDTSSSMLEPAAGGDVKLQLALDAASAFVDTLALPADQAAVVVFSSRADVLQSLTGNRLALQLALSRLFDHVRIGSRLDLGLLGAVDALAAAGRDPTHTPVVILLSDGLGDPASARAAAAKARGGGVMIYTIGLGATADGTLLAELAGDPGRYHFSPDGADLLRIYLDIARATATGCGN